MKYTFFTFAKDQFRPVGPVLKKDLNGKTGIVVGANIGIGYETSKHFALMGISRLVLACRSRERGEAAIKRLEQETGFKNAELRLVDLTSFASVKNFVADFEKDPEARLDILVLNAAIMSQASNPRTADGWEASLQTNDLSTSLLALLFLPLLTKTSNLHDTTPRIVVLTSGTHYLARLDKKIFDTESPLRTLDAKEYYDPETAVATAQGGRYNDTKLLNVFFARALAARLPSNRSHPIIIANAVNPGMSYTAGLTPEFKVPFASILLAIFKFIFSRSIEQAARQVVWGALADQPGINGSYISEMTIVEPSDYVVSDEGVLAEEKLWDNLIEELSKVEPSVKEIVSQYLEPAKPH